MKLTQLEFATWIQQVYRDKQFQLGQTTFLREADPDGLVVSALFTGGQNNPGGYSTKDMDALLTQGRAELNVDKRKAIYKRISEIVADETRGSACSRTRSSGRRPARSAGSTSTTSHGRSSRSAR